MVEFTFGVDQKDPVRQPHAKELARRLIARLPSTLVDWERGNASVHAGLDRLISLGTPEVILRSHRAYFGNVVFVSVNEPHWPGVLATSYIHSIWSPMDDAVVVEVQGTEDDSTLRSIARQLAAALGLVSYATDSVPAPVFEPDRSRT